MSAPAKHFCGAFQDREDSPFHRTLEVLPSLCSGSPLSPRLPPPRGAANPSEKEGWFQLWALELGLLLPPTALRPSLLTPRTPQSCGFVAPGQPVLQPRRPSSPAVPLGAGHRGQTLARDVDKGEPSSLHGSLPFFFALSVLSASIK